MKRILSITLFMLFAHVTFLQAQFFNCDSFCVVSIVYDTAQIDYLYVTIANNDSNFINYPVVQLIASNGDTVANQEKHFDFFGQAPHSVQTYHITTTLDSFPHNWTGELRLEDGLFHDACIIAYPCNQAVSAVNEMDALYFNVYPNPVFSVLTITSPFYVIDEAKLTDAFGRVVYTIRPQTPTATMDTRGIVAGVYFLWVSSANKKMIKKICIAR